MDLKVGGKYNLTKKLGSGAFGEVYLAVDMQTKEEAAVKMEKNSTQHPQLLYETKLYKLLHDGVGIPRHWFGVEGDYNVMVMDLLGPSLEDLFAYCNRKFTLKTLMLADQMIQRIEYIHSRLFLHRDIKPDNFLIGVQLGTLRYSLMRELSNRDETTWNVQVSCCSISYWVLYPGRVLGLKAKRRNMTRFLKRNGACQLRNYAQNQLKNNLPMEFTTYMNYCRGLGFEDRPDYSYLRKLFKDLFYKNGYEYDYIFDWMIQKKKNQLINEQFSKNNQQDQQHNNQSRDFQYLLVKENQDNIRDVMNQQQKLTTAGNKLNQSSHKNPGALLFQQKQQITLQQQNPHLINNINQLKQLKHQEGIDEHEMQYMDDDQLDENEELRIHSISQQQQASSDRHLFNIAASIYINLVEYLLHISFLLIKISKSSSGQGNGSGKLGQLNKYPSFLNEFIPQQQANDYKMPYQVQQSYEILNKNIQLSPSQQQSYEPIYQQQQYVNQHYMNSNLNIQNILLSQQQQQQYIINNSSTNHVKAPQNNVNIAMPINQSDMSYIKPGNNQGSGVPSRQQIQNNNIGSGYNNYNNNAVKSHTQQTYQN